MARRLVLENRSSYRDAPIHEIVAAVDGQLHSVARHWGEYVYRLSALLRQSGWRIVLLDDADQADALGYHDVGPDGPYARVFVNPILQHGGTWTDGALSVSVTVSHEAIETVLDPAANRWANDGGGMLWALEGCDAVESDCYQHGDVTVSNFVQPNYFNPWATDNFDYLNVCSRPFEVRPGGYAITLGRDGIGLVYGDGYPMWRVQETKQTFGSRTFARTRG